MDTFKTSYYNRITRNPSINFANIVLITERMTRKIIDETSGSQKKNQVPEKKDGEVHQIESRPY